MGRKFRGSIVPESWAGIRFDRQEPRSLDSSRLWPRLDFYLPQQVLVTDVQYPSSGEDEEEDEEVTKPSRVRSSTTAYCRGGKERRFRPRSSRENSRTKRSRKISASVIAATRPSIDSSLLFTVPLQHHQPRSLLLLTIPSFQTLNSFFFLYFKKKENKSRKCPPSP